MSISNPPTKQLIVSCPTCQKNVLWDDMQKFKPFCSERCKLIDLGEWAAEEKKIPGAPVYSEYDSDTFLQ